MSHVRFQLGTLVSQVDASVQEFHSAQIISRIWKKDHSIWRTEDVHKKSILNRLGWLHSVELMQRHISELRAFAEEIKVDGFKHAVVLGMGGSSLCPDVCRATFGAKKGYPELLVLDSTNPVSVRRIEDAIDLERTLFVVASKSGGTTETKMFYKYFYDKVERKKGKAGQHFIAVTDAGTPMEEEAKLKKFRKIFLNPEDIGGRYSALSYFGVVPMALCGMDIGRILGSAAAMAEASRSPVLEKNSAAMMGIVMGEAWSAGRDKLTFVGSKGVETFGYWAEQLVAESTGKEGKGIVPVEGESLRGDYSKDRFFVFMRLRSDDSLAAFRQGVEAKGYPVVEIVLDDTYDLGGEFFRWEFATAVAAVVMNINPFDEPNVKESKDNTNRVIDEFRESGMLPTQDLGAEEEGSKIFSETSYRERLLQGTAALSFNGMIRSHVDQSVAGDYIAVLAYIDQNEDNFQKLQQLRQAILARTQRPTTIGFGPRYLHSTGQLHKGGPPKGIFVIITADEPADEKIPGEPFTFEVLKQAQAIGDYQSLASRSLRVVRVHFKKNIGEGLTRLAAAFS
ncbi:MAG TPA: glucose-6-phosphate isomerase [Bacteroidota bacterium]|nr:glucose-6-phosphate isomerase [Bacteroidota bacterium]